MAAIASIASAAGAFAANEATLAASDTITINSAKLQLAVFRNGTAGSLTATIDGDGGTTVTVPGLGVVSVAAGYAVVVPAGETRAVILGSVSAYCQGIVTISGAATMKFTLFDL